MYERLRILITLGVILLIPVRVWSEPVTEAELDAYLSEGRWSEAESRARAAVATHPDAVSLLMLGRLLFASGRTDQLEEALTCLERATVLDPDLASAWYWLGRARGQGAGQGDMMQRALMARQAGSCLTRALELEPDCFSYAWALVAFNLQVPGLLGGDRAAARSIAAGFVGREAGEADLLEAAVALEAGDVSRVMDLLRSVEGLPDVATTAAWTTIATELGEVLLRHEQWTAAAELFLLTAERLPDENAAWVGLGRAREGGGDTAGAALAYARYLERAPDSPRTDAIRQRTIELQP